jgi:hypothetical protein
MKRAMLMNDVKRCIEHKEWPGYGPESYDMQLTYQARQEWEQLNQLSGGMR